MVYKQKRYYIYGHEPDGSKILEFTTDSEKRALTLREYVKRYRASASILDNKVDEIMGLPKYITG